MAHGDGRAHPSADEPLTPAERQFLIDSGAPPDAFDPDRKEVARERLRARAEETKRKASPELSVRQVAQLLGSSESQVIGWAGSLDLYAYSTDAGLRLPEWQFPDAQRLPHLRQVLSELGAQMHPYSVEGLLALATHEELDGQTAVQWLAGGGSPRPVVLLAISSNYDM